MNINNIIQMVNETLSLTYYQELLHTFEDVFGKRSGYKFDINKENGKVVLHLTPGLTDHFVLNEVNCKKLSSIKFDTIYIDTLFITPAFELLASNIDNILPSLFFTTSVCVNYSDMESLKFLTESHMKKITKFNVWGTNENILDIEKFMIFTQIPPSPSGHDVIIRSNNNEIEKIINCDMIKELRKYIDTFAFMGEVLMSNSKFLILEIAYEEYRHTKDFNKFIDTLIEHDMEDWL